MTARAGGWALGVLLLAGAAALFLGAARWNVRTRELDAALGAARPGGAPPTFDVRELEKLPAPVRRYLHLALRGGQPVVASARIATSGEFLLDAEKKRWAPFTAGQLVTVDPPGFDWDARIRMFPGLNVFVRDAYREGAGILRAEAAALVTVTDLAASPELARGELLRWLAEAPWFPTALLPSQGVRWDAVDDDRAAATVVDRGVTATVEFRFGPDGFPASIFVPDRPRIVGAMNVPTPWEGTWSAFAPRNGMHVPSAGEVAWLLPGGRLPYWRGRLRSIAYAFANLEGSSTAAP